MTSRIVKSSNPAKWKGLRERITGLAKKDVVVGVTRATAGRDDEVNNATLAAIHEFGVPEKKIPERDFIRSAFAKHKEEHIKSHAANLKKVVRGEMAAEEAMSALGEQAAGDVQDNIRTGNFKELADSTVARKGSTQPLIDSGDLRKSITHEVRDAD